MWTYFRPFKIWGLIFFVYTHYGSYDNTILFGYFLFFFYVFLALFWNLWNHSVQLLQCIHVSFVPRSPNKRSILDFKILLLSRITIIFNYCNWSQIKSTKLVPSMWRIYSEGVDAIFKFKASRVRTWNAFCSWQIKTSTTTVGFDATVNESVQLDSMG